MKNKVKRATYDDNSYVEYSYDDRGIKEKEVYYDATTIDGSKQYRTVGYSYDGMGRLTNQQFFEYGLSPASVVKEIVTDYYDSGKVQYQSLYGVGGLLEKETYYEYDVLARLVKTVVDPGTGKLNLTTERIYDDKGNVISQVDAKGNIQYSDYDNANRKIATYFTVPGGTAKSSDLIKQSMEYYKNGLLKKTTEYDTSARSHGVLSQTELIFDSRLRPKTIKQDKTTVGDQLDVTDYVYSDSGLGPNSDYNVEITDAEGEKTYWAYDYFGNPAEILYASGDYQQIEYNADGTVYRKAVFDDDPAEEWLTYEYDAYSRLKKTNYPDSGGYIENYYDGFGRKTSVADNRTNTDDNIGGDGVIDYAYGVLGNIESIIDQDGYKIAYAYYADGQKKSVDVYDNSTTQIYSVAYDLDDAMRLSTVREPMLGLTGLIANLDFDANGNRESISYSKDGIGIGGHITMNYTYNTDNALVKYYTAGGPSYTFGGVSGPNTDQAEVDGLGRLVNGIEELTHTDNTTIVTYKGTYAYDLLSELTTATINDVTNTLWWQGSYTYRLDGSLKTRTVTGKSPTTFSFDSDADTYDDCDLLTGATGGDIFSMGHDDNGNMLNLPNLNATNSLEYNWDNKLRFASNASNTVHVKYDPDGNRIYKSSTLTGTRKYIIDPVGKLSTILLEIDTSDSSIAKTYIYANEQVIAQHNGDTSANRYFCLADRIGSIRQVVDVNGNVVARYTFDPFGEAFATEVHEFITNAFRFTGQYFDAETGQYYMRARQYDPSIGRFTTRDPVTGNFKDPMSLHPYLYCMNDPINHLDPTGEFFGGYLDILWTNSIVTKMRGMTVASGAWVMSYAQRLYYAAYTRVIDLYLWATQNVSGYKPGCFTGNTKIYSTKGEVAISKIKVGDMVWSYNENTRKNTQNRIVNIFRHDVNSLLVLQLDGEVIETTEEHPFWVLEKGWVKAGELEVGTCLTTFNGEKLQIKKITHSKQKAVVYNIEVEGDHNYFVSHKQILVHNKAQWFPRWATTNVNRVFKNLADHHGISRHLASQRLHDLKQALGLPPDYNLIFDLTGNVYNAAGVLLGSLTQGGGG